jgi:hypothetical protein
MRDLDRVGKLTDRVIRCRGEGHKLNVDLDRLRIPGLEARRERDVAVSPTRPVLSLPLASHKRATGNCPRWTPNLTRPLWRA